MDAPVSADEQEAAREPRRLLFDVDPRDRDVETAGGTDQGQVSVVRRMQRWIGSSLLSTGCPSLDISRGPRSMRMS